MSETGRALRIDYPDDLPISAARAEIAAALAEHRVIVVCGETGSGKTTQLPKICLEAGRGRTGLIGHTQPRRLAARAVATRLATELDCELGAEVGYHVRFNERTDPRTRIKVMTDGILLNEIRSDRNLDRYDTLIVDEAHERSLNVDFLLGYLKLVLEHRPDLRVIITSATVDPESFARYFAGAPVLDVPGKTYPITTEYRPVAEDEDLADAVAAACRELAERASAENMRRLSDVLVFLPGERWIRDAERALARNGPPDYEVLSLYARLPAAQQDRIFNPGAAPRIVLATNVAETSLTVPRIRFVVDSGLARVSRYSARHRIQTLGVEPIAQANAIQRAGRCGRLAPGICMRLYSEDHFAARPRFPDPEIVRTNLAGVILRLQALGLGSIGAFPFLDEPPDKTVNDAFRLLQVLGALDDRRRLTKDGRRMGRLPLDPRLSRLLVAGERKGCLDEALTLAAVLGTGDPREQPPGPDAAREVRAEFTDSRSDFMSYLKLWRAYLRRRRQGQKALRAWCRDRYLSANRLREWDDVRTQLKSLLRQFGWKPKRGEGDYATIHQALIAAFADYIAERDDGTYRGMHGARARLFPGTGVVKPPRWIVAAEHVATERNYLRTVGRINPRWVIEMAPHLVKRDYLEPCWDRRRGHVSVRERAMAFGLVLSQDRRVDLGRMDPGLAREIFIRDALAADDLGVPLPFLEHNRAVKRRILDWEARTRSRDLYIGDRGLAAFYEANLPAAIHDRRGLVHWCRDGRRAASLEVEVGELATRDVGEAVAADFPDTLTAGGQRLALEYRYEPGHPRDGITLRLPRVLVDVIEGHRFEWLVPGALREKTLALLKTMPKEARRPLVPLPDTVDRVLPALKRRFGQEPLVGAIRAVLLQSLDRGVPAGAMRPDALPEHLHMAIELVDETGATIARSRDFASLRREYGGGRRLEGGHERSGPATPEGEFERRGLRLWTCGDLPERVAIERYGTTLELYPALVDSGPAVDLTLLPPGPSAAERHRRGVRRLLLLSLRQQAGLIRDSVLGDRQLLLAFHGVGSGEALVADLLAAAADEAFALDPPPRARRGFERVLGEGRAAFVPKAEGLIALLREILPRYRELNASLPAPGEDEASSCRDAEGAALARQLARLVYPGFLSGTPVAWRRSLPRFLEAMQLRRARRGGRGTREADYQREIDAAWARFAARRDSLPPGWPLPPALARYRWLIEELGVSLFAQSLGTTVPVSAKRLDAFWRDEVLAERI